MADGLAGENMFKKILFASLISLTTLSNAATELHPSFITGAGFTQAGNGQSILLTDTPEPGLENYYTQDSKHRGSFLLGFAIDKALWVTRFDMEGSVGIELDYLRNPSMRGVVYPMINVAPDFDRMNYSFELTSYLLQANAKISKRNLLNHFGAYLQAGVGDALNYLSDYHEVSPKGSSAAPMLAPFGNQSNLRFAYSIGVGIFYQPFESAKFSIGYRYINTGNGSLDRTPIQKTNQSLKFSPLNHQFIIVSLSV